MSLRGVTPVGVTEKAQEEEEDGQSGQDKDEAHRRGKPGTARVCPFTAATGSASKTPEEAVGFAT